MKYKLRDRLVFQIHNDWKQIFGKYNWYSFHVCYIYLEKDEYIGGWEFWLVLLGIGFYFRINNDKALRQFDKWNREAKGEVKN